MLPAWVLKRVELLGEPMCRRCPEWSEKREPAVPLADNWAWLLSHNQRTVRCYETIRYLRNRAQATLCCGGQNHRGHLYWCSSVSVVLTEGFLIIVDKPSFDAAMEGALCRTFLWSFPLPSALFSGTLFELVATRERYYIVLFFHSIYRPVGLFAHDRNIAMFESLDFSSVFMGILILGAANEVILNLKYFLKYSIHLHMYLHVLHHATGLAASSTLTARMPRARVSECHSR